MRRAVSASVDQISDLNKKLDAAQQAITELQKTVASAQAAMAAHQVERDAGQKTIALAESAIKQQQALIEDYKSVIKTLTDLTQMALARVDKLEEKLDKANGRTATLGALLTIVSTVGIIILKR